MTSLHAPTTRRTCMKRLITGLTAALALAFVGTARADDTKATESKSTTQKSETTKDAPSPYTDTSKEGMGGSGTTTKAEKKSTKEKETTTKTDEAKTTPAK